MATTYNDLDVNQRINLKAILHEWAKYTVQDFQASLDKNVYSKRVKRNRRTQKLRNTWYQQTTDTRVLMTFLMYGRYLELGVGRGTSATSRVVSRQLRLGSETARKKRPWYARKKGYQFHRLRELLVAAQIEVSQTFLESALTINFAITV